MSSINMNEIWLEMRKTEYEKFEDMTPLCDGSAREVFDIRYGYDPHSYSSTPVLVSWCGTCEHIVRVYYDVRDPDTDFRLRYHDTEGKSY